LPCEIILLKSPINFNKNPKTRTVSLKDLFHGAVPVKYDQGGGFVLFHRARNNYSFFVFSVFLMTSPLGNKNEAIL